MTKTIREWLEELPEPQRSCAIENCNVDMDIKEVSLSKAVKVAFFWGDSPQGFHYWINICNDIISEEISQSKP
jgi:hypothetical protein